MTSAGGSHARQKWARMLPTLTVRGNYNRKGASAKSGDGLATVLRRMMESSGRGLDLNSTLRVVFPESTGIINPSWGECYMGYPIGWTELLPSEPPSSRKSPNSSGGQS